MENDHQAGNFLTLTTQADLLYTGRTEVALSYKIGISVIRNTRLPLNSIPQEVATIGICHALRLTAYLALILRPAMALSTEESPTAATTVCFKLRIGLGTPLGAYTVLLRAASCIALAVAPRRGGDDKAQKRNRRLHFESLLDVIVAKEWAQ